MKPVHCIPLSLFVLFFALLSPVEASWKQDVEHDAIAYFLFDYPSRMELYDLAAQSWLPAITLPSSHGLPSVFHVDDHHIYVAYDKALYRYNHDGTGEQHIINTNESLVSIHTDGDLLILNHSVGSYARCTTLNRLTLVIIDTLENYIDSIFGASFAPSHNRIIGSRVGTSPDDVTYVEYADDGTFVGGGDSPHHGDYPYANQTWMFPDEARFVDDSGTMYATDSLRYTGAFGTGIDDLAFHGEDIPIVLQGDTLTSFSNSVLPAGSLTLPAPAKSLFVHGSDAFAFSSKTSGNGISLTIVALSDLKAPEPGQPVNPVGLPFEPDAVFVGSNDIVYLFSSSQQSLFPWDPEEQRFLTAIPLIGSPAHAAYSPVTHTAYFAYDSGLIRQMDLSAAEPAEEPFTNLAQTPLGLATAGQYVFAVDPSGAWVSHYTFHPDGSQISAVDWNYRSQAFIWSEANQKLYFFRDDTSPNDLLWEEINADGVTYPDLGPGEIGAKDDSPLHSSSGFAHPIRVAPDGSIVLLGSGRMHNAQTLERLPSGLANGFDDAAWFGSYLNTLRSSNGQSQLQRWSGSTFANSYSSALPGEPHSLTAIDGQTALAITMDDAGIPMLHLINGNFDPVPPSVLHPPTNLQANTQTGPEVVLTWSDTTGELAYRVERRPAGAGDDAWTALGTPLANSRSYTDPSVAIGQTYQYRVIATHGALESVPTPPVEVGLIIPVTPTGLAAAFQPADNSVLLSWNDVANEAEYELERRLLPNGAWNPVSPPAAADETSYTDTFAFTLGETYAWRIRAANLLGNSPWSAEASLDLPVPAPEAPGLDVHHREAYSIRLRWDNVDYDTSQTLQRRLLPDGAWQVLQTFAEPLPTTYTDTGLTPNTQYEYRIQAGNVTGLSPWSNEVQVSTLELLPPRAPEHFRVRSQSATSLLLTWTDVLNEEGYKVERSLDGATGWSLLQDLPAGSTSFTDTNLTTGTIYHYRLTAWNSAGSSTTPVHSEAPVDIQILVRDNFNGGYDPTAWSALSGGEALDGGVGFLDAEALWFGHSLPRQVTTVPLNLSSGGVITFEFRAGDGSSQYWEKCDYEESVSLDYSTDNGVSWKTLYTLDTQLDNFNWTIHTVNIAPGLIAAPALLRWRQASASGPHYDTWALENVEIQAIVNTTPPDAPPFLLSGANSSSVITLYWGTVRGADSYRVQRKAGTADWVTIGTVSSFTNFFVDSGLVPSTVYAFRVQALAGDLSSDWSLFTLEKTWSRIEEWRFHNYGTTENAGDAANYALAPDGLHNLTKFAFNLPAESSHTWTEGRDSGLPQFARNEDGSLCVRFIRRTGDPGSTLKYRVEFSDNLTDWTPADTAYEITPINAQWELVECHDSSGTAVSRTNRYGRVKIREN